MNLEYCNLWKRNIRRWLQGTQKRVKPLDDNDEEFHIMHSVETAHVNEGNHLELETMKRGISMIKDKVENLIW